MNWRRRIPQWITALRRAHGIGVPIPWLKMLRGILTPVPRAVWRERLRYGCYQCPLFDKDNLICCGVMGPLKGIGCRCYLPFKALSAAPYEDKNHRGCYGRVMFGDDFGWGEHVFASRWEILTALPRFLLGR